MKKGIFAAAIALLALAGAVFAQQAGRAKPRATAPLRVMDAASKSLHDWVLRAFFGTTLVCAFVAGSKGCEVIFRKNFP